MKKQEIIFSLLILILIIILSGISIIKKFNLDITNIIAFSSMAITLISTILAAGIVFYQLRENNEWNKRHIALIETTRSHTEKDIDEVLLTLNKFIDYHNRKKPYTLKEIHIFLCGNPNFTQEILDMTKDGPIIKKSIVVILNYYEYLATGILNNIFSETVIKDLSGTRLVKAYAIFSIYIEHLRTPRHYDTPRAYINLETIAKRWENS